MKKFFSLVLALVMALSLTTVAWGATGSGTTADPYVVGDTADLTTVLGTVASGSVIKLTENVTFSGQNAADKLSGYVIDLNDKTMTLSGNTYLTGETTIMNGKIVVSGAISDSYLCLYTASTKLTLDDVELTGTFDAYAVLNGAAGSTLVIKNSVIDVQGNITNPDSMGNIIYGGNVTVDNSTIKGKNTVRGIGLSNVTIQNNSTVEISDVETGLNNSTVTVDDSTVTITNATKRAVRLNNNTLTLQGGATLKAENCAEDIVGIGTTDTVSVSSDSTLNAVDGVTPVYVAEVGGTKYESLTEAMKAVTSSNNTLTLLDNVTISEKWDCRYNGAKFTVPVTIDGNGKTLKLTGAVDDKNWNTVFRFEGETATVKNLTIDVSEATGVQRGISSKGSIVVENCTFIGNGTSKRAIIFGEGAGSALGNVTATVTGSNFEDWTIGVSDNQSGKDAKSVSITNSTFENADVLVSASETVTFTGNTMDGGEVNISSYSATNELAVTATGNTLDADEDNEIDAKTITTDTNDFAITGTLTAPAGYQVLKTTTGDSVVVPAVTFGDKFDLYLADAGMNAALKAKTPDVAGLSFDEFDAKTNKDGSGRVAYIAANNGEYFVKTTSPTIVDYAVTDAGKNTVLYYVTVAGTSAANFEYEEAVTAFDKFSAYDKCGYVTGTPVAGKSYFVASDDLVYMAGDAGTGTNYLLNGKVVSGIPAGAAEEHTFVLNGYKYDATLKQNIPTSAVCTKCLMNTGSIYLRTKVPATYTLYTTTGEGSVNYTVALPGTAAVVPSVPSTDKVESADTFDAGIAMYVGMSVMAAAGSAVVLKKKD